MVMLEDFLWWVASKSRPADVCPSVQAFSTLVPERLADKGRVNIRSTRRNGERNIISFAYQSIARGMWRVPRANAQTLEKTISSQGCRLYQWTDSTQTG